MGPISTSLVTEESKDLAGRLQSSLQRIQELERALSAACTQQQEEDRASPTSCPVPWQPGFPDGGESVKVPSGGCSVLPRRQHAHFSLLLCVVVRGSLGLSQLLWMSWGGAVGGEHWMQSLEAKCLPCPYLAVVLAKS